MGTKPPAPRDIDAYIAGFPDDVRMILEEIRRTIKTAVPGAEEAISYRIPAFTLGGRYLLYIAAYERHIGLYPAPLENAELKAELAAYASGKGTMRLALDEPIPYDLIGKIVKLRATENSRKADGKGRTR